MRNGKFCCALWGCGWVASGHLAAYLKNKDCEVIGMIITQADEDFLNSYYN